MLKIKNYFNHPDLGSLLFRLFIGLAIAFAWAASLSELLGGLLIAAGLYARYAALFMGVTMSVAAFMVHATDPFRVKEMALLYLAACVILLFQGAGKYSLDRIFRKV